MDKNSTLLEVKNVSVTFQDPRGKKLHILSNINFSLRGGMLAVVLGDSGSGKSTLLNVIAGFLRPSSGFLGGHLSSKMDIKGNVFIDGENVTLWEPKDRPIGLVMQHFTLYPHMSVRQNLAFPLKMRGVSKNEREKMIDKVIEELDMKGFERSRTDDLSGGQKQRVAIGKLIMREPIVALFDEAFSNLDPILRRDLRNRVIDNILHGDKSLRRCVLFVSHEVLDAKKADLIIVLRTNDAEGQIQTIPYIFEGSKPGEAWTRMQASVKSEVIEFVVTAKE